MRKRPGRLPAVAATAALAATLGWTAGCSPESHELLPGRYRAVVELPGGEVPFGLEVARTAQGVTLDLVNGGARVRVPALVDMSGNLTAELPGRGNRLDAKVSGNDIEGQVTLSGGPGGAPVELAFSAARGAGWRFVESPRTDNADFAGRWAFEFTDDAGRRTRGVAEFVQRFHAVAGTVRTAGSTVRGLAGDAHDERLMLSLFDGTQAVLYRGELNARGELVGEAWGTATGHLRYTAVRNHDATL